MLITDLSADVRTTADLLIACSPGETVLFTTISKALGRDVTRRRQIISAARKVAQREAGALFRSERGMGYRRLAPTEADQIGHSALVSIGRGARRANGSMSALIKGANDMPPDQFKKILAQQTALGMIHAVTKTKNLPKITETATRPLPLAVSAKAFLRSIGATVPTEED